MARHRAFVGPGVSRRRQQGSDDHQISRHQVILPFSRLFAGIPEWLQSRNGYSGLTRLDGGKWVGSFKIALLGYCQKLVSTASD
jgi:hypothetical protein